MIVALCGGVGGSKLVSGLYRILPPDSLTVVVNTADDLEIIGLHVSPDLDTVTYTLAGLVGAHGWGLADDTFNALDMLARYGLPTWFQVGDRDVATHLVRTESLRRGRTLTAITKQISEKLGVQATVLPMTDQPVATQLRVRGEWIEFQEYFVHRRHQEPVEDLRYEGIDKARITPEGAHALDSAEAIILVNSNPALSILPILSVPGVREAVQASAAVKVAVSPIVRTDAVSGPAGDLMRLLGHPASATGVAETYGDVIGGIVIDRRDADQATAIKKRGLAVLCTDTIMRDQAHRDRLAQEVVRFARGLR